MIWQRQIVWGVDKEKFGYAGNDLLEAGVIAFNESKWGQAVLKHDDGKTLIEIANSVLAQSVTAQKKAVCHPFAGYFAGFLETMEGKHVKVREVECLAMGHLRCVFQIE